MEKVQAHVRWNFSMLLYDDGIVKLRALLDASVCTKVDNDPKNAAASGAGWRTTSIMEPLDMGHCISALTHSNFYEGHHSIWNLSQSKTSAFETELNLRDPTLLQLNFLVGHWSEDHLTSSHSDEETQRYFFPGMVMSFLKDFALLQATQGYGTGLCEMPAGGGCHLFVI